MRFQEKSFIIYLFAVFGMLAVELVMNLYLYHAWISTGQIVRLVLYAAALVFLFMKKHQLKMIGWILGSLPLLWWLFGWISVPGTNLYFGRVPSLFVTLQMNDLQTSLLMIFDILIIGGMIAFIITAILTKGHGTADVLLGSFFMLFATMYLAGFSSLLLVAGKLIENFIRFIVYAYVFTIPLVLWQTLDYRFGNYRLATLHKYSK